MTTEDRKKTDDLYLSRCFALAKLGGRKTLSNPNVGCVIVYKDRIIGEGFHRSFGAPHAEVDAIKSVDEKDFPLLKHAAMYVSLEPCSHYGKTPPCAELIVHHQIPEVVIGAIDPNPKVAGKGVQYLRNHGVTVTVHNSPIAENIIGKFRKNLQQKPYVILKWAQSKDRFIGRKDEQIWLSHPHTSILTHSLRSQVDGIAIGKNTWLTDKPQLTDRYFQNHFQPIKIIFDRNNKVAPTLMNYNRDEKIIVVNEDFMKEMDQVRFLKCGNTNDLDQVLKSLYQHGIHSILVEGGAKLLQHFIEQNAWDEARIIHTNVKLETGIKAPNISGKIHKVWHVGPDKIVQIFPTI
ncbi:MAG: bifunctional diaminohydroxyphosphoribosylaminopyrimidine deaminase/5-amino-6-(5-phosphoribosylamino)uracil reductase RibD [Lewinellaceae bacterium]|nr:bifunctional diaminohydroxyphosphoribosylaminopyrimidine deaminase/5-amino-6-(5-phosphoribosylamino)uracil reductase RibD [Lewinellaceae bacterium]